MVRPLPALRRPALPPRPPHPHAPLRLRRPLHEALELIRLAADRRPVVDVGSGNGYWSFMLRRYGLDARPVDNMQSEWRVNWVDDTEVADGVDWLARHEQGRGLVLLLVYPVVGGGVAGGSRVASPGTW